MVSGGVKAINKARIHPRQGVADESKPEAPIIQKKKSLIGILGKNPKKLCKWGADCSREIV
jgi:hypothetical protein